MSCSPSITAYRDFPNVEYSILRDVDSRFTLRELMAVNKWIGSGLDFHSMRDHPWHSTAIMGCCFGMKRGMLDRHDTSMVALVKDALLSASSKLKGGVGGDQNFLAHAV